MALALLYRTNFWFLVIWAPVGVIIAGVWILASRGEFNPFNVGILLSVLVALAVFAALSLILARGIATGNRVAYFFVGFAIFAMGAVNALAAALTIPLSPPAVVLGISRFVVFGFFGTVIFILGAKRGATDG